MKKYFAALFVVSLAMWSANAFAASDADLAAAHDQARRALRDGQYAQTIQLTKSLGKSDPQHSLNWYRMAIAATRTGDFMLANTAIARAEVLDPTLKFASTPGHVSRLKATIEAGLAPVLAVPPGPVPAAVVAIDAAAAASTDDPAAASAAVQSAISDVSKKLDQLAAGQRQVEAALASSATQAPGYWQTAAPWVVGFLLMVMGLLGVLVTRLRKHLTELRQSRADKLAVMPMDDLIRYVLDANATVIQRLKIHGHSDTDLFVQLQRSLPALERESGRARVDVAAASEGLALQDSTVRLRPRDPILGRVDPHALHANAAAAALQGGASRLNAPDIRRAA